MTVHASARKHCLFKKRLIMRHFDNGRHIRRCGDNATSTALSGWYIVLESIRNSINAVVVGQLYKQ